MKAWSIPSGEGCSAYSNFTPNWLPSPKRRLKPGRSNGVEIIRISRIPWPHYNRNEWRSKKQYLGTDCSDSMVPIQRYHHLFKIFFAFHCMWFCKTAAKIILFNQPPYAVLVFYFQTTKIGVGCLPFIWQQAISPYLLTGRTIIERAVFLFSFFPFSQIKTFSSQIRKFDEVYTFHWTSFLSIRSLIIY